MVKGDLRLFVPNPHEGAIGRDLSSRILRQAGVEKTIGRSCSLFHPLRRQLRLRLAGFPRPRLALLTR